MPSRNDQSPSLAHVSLVLHRTTTEIARLAVATIPACDLADVTLMADGRPVTTGATDPVAADLDAVQDATGRGPCIDACRSGAVRGITSTRTETRWPEYTRRAFALGIGSVLAVPLVADDGVLGSLNLHARREQAFGATDVDAARLVATHAAMAVANAQVAVATGALAGQLREALVARATIEQAKGVLVARSHCTPDEAFATLVRRSQHENRKLRLVAEDILRDAQT